MKQLYVEVNISLSVGTTHIGNKVVHSYLYVLKEDLQSFMRKMELARKETVTNMPSSTEIETGSLNLDLLSVKFNNEFITKDSELFKTVQAMVFEL